MRNRDINQGEESGTQNKLELDAFSINKIIKLMNEEDKKVAYAVEKSLSQIEEAITCIYNVMQDGGKLYYIGSGTSGRLGILDASECPPTFGVNADLVTGIIAGGEQAIRNAIEDAEDNETNGKKDVAGLITEKDVLVGIAASGNTPYVIGGIKKANEIGASTVGISCNNNSKMSKEVDHPIELKVGTEIIEGSTRLKAGTAQKMVLNMISTTTMIKLGKVYGNKMINVQATNQKLRNRAFQIVKDITNANDEKIHEALGQATGNTAAAIIMLDYNLSKNEAFEVLKKGNNNFRVALKILEDEREINPR